MEITKNLAISFLIVATINLVKKILKKIIKNKEILNKIKIIYSFLPFFLSFILFLISFLTKLNFLNAEDVFIIGASAIAMYDVIVKNIEKFEKGGLDAAKN